MKQRADLIEEKRQLLDAYRGDRSRLIDLFTRLEGGRPTSQKPHEARWRNSGSLWVNLRRGGFKDHEADVGGNVIDAVIHYTGSNYRGAVNYLRDHLGWPVDEPLPQIDEEQRKRREEADLAADEEQRASDAEKFAKAQRLWSEGRNIHGTPGQVYLEQTRALGARQWDASIVRWHDAGRMLVFVVTADDGEFVGIQRIAVTRDGQKDLRWKGGKKPTAKLSLGPVGQGVVRLPGKSAELCVGEGPETCLSAWIATGFETFIALGSRTITPPPGRRVIYLRDDDKRNPKTERKRRELLREWKKEGLSFIDATPFAMRRENKGDFNDLLKERGLDAVRERINLFARGPVTMASHYQPLDVARDELYLTSGPIIDEFAEWTKDGGLPAPVYAVKLTVGGGKTFAAMVHIIRKLKEMRARGDNRVFVIAVPYHDLGENLARDFHNIPDNPFKAAPLRGREAKRPGAVDKDDRMCGRVDDVKLAQKLRVKIGEELCKVCSLRDECAYMAQRAQNADVWFVAHKTIAGPVPAAIGRDRVAGLIIDETSWLDAAIPEIEIPLALLEPGAMPTSRGDGPLGAGRHEDIRSRLKYAAEVTGAGPIPKAALASVGISEETGLDLVKMEGYRTVTSGPWRERLQNRTVGWIMAAGFAVADLMKSGRDASGRLVVGRNEDNEPVLFVCGKADPHEDWRVPTLIIDAHADLDMLRLFWPTVELRGDIHVDAPHMRVHQVKDRAFSKSMLAPLTGERPHDEKKRARYDELSRYKANSLRNLRAFIYRVARRNGGRTLVIANEAVERALKAAGLPPHVETLHFNALVGRNDFGDVRSLIVVGRTQPRTDHVEAMVAALTGEVIEPLPGWYPIRDAVRVQRGEAGELLQIVGEAEGHPHPVAEKIRRRICEGEIEQAVGRCRGVTRTAANPCDVFILSTAAIELPVDEFLDADEVMTPSPLDLMLSAGGIAFADGSSASEAYKGRGLWRTPDAAKKAIQRDAERQRSGTLPKEDISLGIVPHLVPVTFQKAGAGQRPQKAWIDPRAVSDPRQTIEAMLGPLARFETIEPEIEAEVVAPIAVNAVGLSAIDLAPAGPVEGGALEPITLVAMGGVVLFKSGGMPPPAWLMGEPIAVEPEPEKPPEPEGDEVELPSDFWARLFATAADCGHSDGEVAERLGVSPCHLSNIKAGRRSVKATFAAAVERYIATAEPVQTRLL